jgi:hypothetical protein
MKVNKNCLIVLSINDIPTLNENDEKSFEEKSKSKHRQQFSFSFNKTSNNNTHCEEVKREKSQILKIGFGPQNLGNGTAPKRVRAASKWDDKTLRTPETKNLKFPKCLPPPIRKSGTISDSRNALVNVAAETRAQNVGSEKRELFEKTSKSPDFKDKHRSR